MLVTVCMSSFAIWLSSPFIVIYVTEIIGLTKTQWGFVEGVSMGIATIVTIPGGLLADRIGRCPFTIFTRLAVFLTNLLYLSLRSFYPILVLRIVWWWDRGDLNPSHVGSRRNAFPSHVACPAVVRASRPN